MALEVSGVIPLPIGTTPTFAGGSNTNFETTQVPGSYVNAGGLVGGLKNHIVVKSRQTGLKIETSFNRTWQNQAAPINGIIQPLYTSSVRVVFETNDPTSTAAVMYNQFTGISSYLSSITRIGKLMSGQV